jgi:hypothetical protein
MSKTDVKTAPSHYRNNSITPTDVIDSWKLNFYLGNTIKYICRAGKKSSETASDDLEKALWYLVRHITESDAVADRAVQFAKEEL